MSCAKCQSCECRQSGPLVCPYCFALVTLVPESQAHPNGIAPLRPEIGSCEFCLSTLPALVTEAAYEAQDAEWDAALAEVSGS